MKLPFSRTKQQSRSPDTPPPPGVAKTEKYKHSYLSFGYMPRKFEQTRQIDITQFKNYSSGDILDMLRVNHPETSFAIWQYLRVANSGITCKAKKMTGEDDKRGQKVLDEKILWQLNHPPAGNHFQESRGINLVTGQLLLDTLMRGACGCEDVLNILGKLDRIQSFDPATVYFQREENRLVPYQRQLIPGSMGYVKIDYPTVFYEALDPATDDPYGTSPLVSLIQVVAWQIGFLNDLQAAVHATGYPRMRIKLMEEIAAKNMPAHIQNDPAKRKEWMDKIRLDVQTAMRNLEPDAIPVMWDSADLDLVGKGGSQTIKIDSVINTINKSLAAALKTLSSIIGIGTDTSKESYAAELKLYSRGIESVQQVVENLLERALTMALNLEGVRGWVDVEFAPVDLRSELQVVAELQTRQDIIITARMRGAISDFEEMKAHREVLGFIGEPEGWEELVNERKEREQSGGQQEDYPRHGSPPANQ